LPQISSHLNYPDLLTALSKAKPFVAEAPRQTRRFSELDFSLHRNFIVRGCSSREPDRELRGKISRVFLRVESP